MFAKLAQRITDDLAPVEFLAQFTLNRLSQVGGGDRTVELARFPSTGCKGESKSLYTPCQVLGAGQLPGSGAFTGFANLVGLFERTRSGYPGQAARNQIVAPVPVGNGHHVTSEP